MALAQRQSAKHRRGGKRIPLVAVVRFRERHWFLEDLQLAREGDAMAMSRLAKMYLHGQGTDPNLVMAHEWARKARYFGANITLEEMVSEDSPILAQLRAPPQARSRARSVAAASLGGGGGPSTAFLAASSVL